MAFRLQAPELVVSNLSHRQIKHSLKRGHSLFLTSQKHHIQHFPLVRDLQTPWSSSHSQSEAWSSWLYHKLVAAWTGNKQMEVNFKTAEVLKIWDSLLMYVSNIFSKYVKPHWFCLHYQSFRVAFCIASFNCDIHRKARGITRSLTNEDLLSLSSLVLLSIITFRPAQARANTSYTYFERPSFLERSTTKIIFPPIFDLKTFVSYIRNVKFAPFCTSGGRLNITYPTLFWKDVACDTCP